MSINYYEREKNLLRQIQQMGDMIESLTNENTQLKAKIVRLEKEIEQTDNFYAHANETYNFSGGR